ncbi:MAG: archaellin/type IV pilin N-terminal domain-containing protein [Thermoplasmatota archaeon]
MALRGSRSGGRSSPSDDAISPVVAGVILVAMTVLLTTTLYVWVSGYAASETHPATISANELASNGCTPGATGVGRAALSILHISAQFPASNLRVVDSTSAAATFSMPFGTSDPVAPGDAITLNVASGTLACSDSIQLVDHSANTIMETIVLHG